VVARETAHGLDFQACRRTVHKRSCCRPPPGRRAGQGSGPANLQAGSVALPNRANSGKRPLPDRRNGSLSSGSHRRRGGQSAFQVTPEAAGKNFVVDRLTNRASQPLTIAVAPAAWARQRVQSRRSCVHCGCAGFRRPESSALASRRPRRIPNLSKLIPLRWVAAASA